MQTINDLGAFIIDMDGVLWQGSKPLPGLTEFFLRCVPQKFHLCSRQIMPV